jgi:hypothetical protein
MASSLEIRRITRLKGSSPKKTSSQDLVNEVSDPTTGQFFVQPASKAALPPAAVVLTVMVCSAQKR